MSRKQRWWSRWLGLVLVASPWACSSDEEPPELEGMTEAHNAARANTNPPADPALVPLEWSGELAQAALDHAEGCSFEHSGSQFGENLFANTGSTATSQGVVDAWVGEQAFYDYGNNACSDVCGHYTQVVWADSRRLGCAKVTCDSDSPFGDGEWDLWVCNYDPPGNFSGERPY